jgi:hypothetical protein
MSKVKTFTVAEVHNELVSIAGYLDIIQNKVNALWGFADQDQDYHTYTLNTEMCATWNLCARAEEVIDNLIDLVSENIDSDDDYGNLTMEYIHNSEDKNE